MNKIPRWAIPSPRTFLSEIISQCQSQSQSKSCRFTSSQQPRMKRRSVVSSFVLTPTRSPEGSKVVIFHRSDDVHTYRNKWAACSGHIDATDSTPEAAARREVKEETKLTSEHFFSFRRGKPFSLTDSSLNIEWVIHPFAALLKPNAPDIKLDWEHTEYRFIPPEEVSDYDHVPNLDLTLQHVIVGKETEETLEELANDHVSGAQELALKALQGLLRAVKGQDLENAQTVEDVWRGLRHVGWHLAKNGRPSMGAALDAAIFKALNIVRTELEGNNGQMTLSAFKDMAEAVIKSQIESRKHSIETLTKNFFNEINSSIINKIDKITSPIRIATLSASGTVASCLSSLIRSSPHAVHLTIFESRPNFEGVTLANRILSLLRDPSDEPIENFTIRILSDASMATALKDTSYFLFGADKVLSSGAVSNKIGTLSACILAKTLNPDCKVLAIFDTDKITSNSAENLEMEYNDEKETMSVWPEEELQRLREWRDRGQNVEVENLYFEWTDAQWIDGYVTEEGILGREEIEKISGRSGELEKRVFAHRETVNMP